MDSTTPQNTNNTQKQLLSQEWMTLQNNVEHYETLALINKLAAFALCVITFISPLLVSVSVALLLLLWLQESILKTFQARFTNRLTAIEQALNNDDESIKPMQFLTQWESQREGSSGLIKEYLSNALRPTIAFPYPLLIWVVLFS